MYGKLTIAGIKVQRHIVSHGFALNVATDLKWFQQIVPCGLVGKDATSLTNVLGKRLEVDDVVPVLIDNFQRVFAIDEVDIEEVD